MDLFFNQNQNTNLVIVEKLIFGTAEVLVNLYISQYLFPKNLY